MTRAQLHAASAYCQLGRPPESQRFCSPSLLEEVVVVIVQVVQVVEDEENS